MAVKWAAVAGMIMILLAACAPLRAETSSAPDVLALLAPFEGRYAEIGYNALYAVRLALDEAGRDDVTLWAMDDGGTVETARIRARALTLDPQIKAVIALGNAATDPQTQAAYSELPVLMIGYWGHVPQSEVVLSMFPTALVENVDNPTGDIVEAAAHDGVLTVGDIGVLSQFALLRENLSGVTVLSAGRLPDADFRERYLGVDLFVPEPTPIATQTYAAVVSLLSLWPEGKVPRGDLLAALLPAFDDGYWRDANLYTYRYSDSGELLSVDDLVE